MTRKIIAGGLALAALVVTLSAQDSKDPVRVESVKLELDPAGCMRGQTKMPITLHVKLSGNEETTKITLNPNCQVAFHQIVYVLESGGEPPATLAVCHVHSNMCTGLPGSSVMGAQCKGQEGEPMSDKKTFSCPQQ